MSDLAGEEYLHSLGRVGTEKTSDVVLYHLISVYSRGKFSKEKNKHHQNNHPCNQAQDKTEW